MTKNEALSLKVGDKVQVRYGGDIVQVWKNPSQDPTGDVIVWVDDGNEWRYHNELDHVK